MASPGLLLWSDLPSKEFLRLASLAEDSGYSELWYTDIRFDIDAYMNLALAAKQTSRILLGPGVSDPYSRHPAMIATAMATLDEMSNGRAQVGLGSGAGDGLAKMGLTQEKPVRGVREAIEIMRLVFKGEPATYEGELFQVKGGKLGFTALRGSIPIFVASHSVQMLKVCGRLADGVLLANMGRREAVEHATSIIRAGEEEGGRAAGSVAIHLRLETCISDDAAGALNVMRRRLAVRLVNTFPRWDHLEELGIVATDAMREAASARNVDGMAQQLSDSDVRSSTLVGSAEEVAEHLQNVLTPAISKVTIRPLAVPGQDIESTITRFIRDVWPAIEPVQPKPAHR